MPTVTAVFLGREDTETAIDELVSIGFDPDALGVVWREKAVPKREEIEVTIYVDHFDDPATEARKGAIGGAVGGGVTGVGSVILASAGGVVLATPVGSLLVVGTLAAAAVAAAAGAVGGSIAGGLIGALLGATDHDATKMTTKETEYRDAIEKDGFILSIDCDEGEVERTSKALEGVGAGAISVLRPHGRPIRTVYRENEDLV